LEEKALAYRISCEYRHHIQVMMEHCDMDKEIDDGEFEIIWFIKELYYYAVAFFYF
jgi:hypothetical protein